MDARKSLNLPAVYERILRAVASVRENRKRS